MTTHTSTLAWEIPWTQEPGGLYSPWGHKRIRHDLATKQQQQHKLFGILHFNPHITRCAYYRILYASFMIIHASLKYNFTTDFHSIFPY